MRRFILLAGFFVISFQLVNAQDIFKEHGFDKEPLTLSNGHYNEFFTNDEVVQIGTVLLNTKTNKIVAFVDEDTSETHYLAELSSRWSSPDPLAAKYPEVSPYVYCANNPIRYVDPDGMRIDEYIFNQNGDYTGKIKKPGEHTGLVMGNDTQKPLAFKFADPENDPKAIDKGEITGVEVVSNEAISEVLDESGVNKQENKVEFITRESDASNLEGEGKMDYVVTAMPSIDGVKQPIRADKLYITQTASGTVAHNNYNFGNFLWGAGASKLGFSKFTAKLGAHINSLRDPHYRRLDSKDDQYSIGVGYEWSKSHK